MDFLDLWLRLLILRLLLLLVLRAWRLGRIGHSLTGAIAGMLNVHVYVDAEIGEGGGDGLPDLLEEDGAAVRQLAEISASIHARSGAIPSLGSR